MNIPTCHGCGKPAETGLGSATFSNGHRYYRVCLQCVCRSHAVPEFSERLERAFDSGVPLYEAERVFGKLGVAPPTCIADVLTVLGLQP